MLVDSVAYCYCVPCVVYYSFEGSLCVVVSSSCADGGGSGVVVCFDVVARWLGSEWCVYPD